MAGFTPKRLYKGVHHLSSPTTTSCTTSDTYYKIGGTWEDGEGCNEGFVYDGSGKLTYFGESSIYFLFNGTSDLKSSKICKITYGLYKNGSLYNNYETPTNFTNVATLRNISITNIIKLEKGDYLEIYVKSDVGSTNVTHNTLMVTFLGEL